MKKLLWISSLLFYCCSAQAQLKFNNNIGGQIGISYNLGTHFKRLGLVGKLYYQQEYIQINLQVFGFYNFESLATKLSAWEAQIKTGIVLAWGKKQNSPNPFLNEISNQTGRAYSIGYSYNFYIDNVQTSQKTGTLGFSIYDFRLLMENDFLAFVDSDKYRTGLLSIYYRIGQTQIGIQQASWTADAYALGTFGVQNDSFPSPYGYRDITATSYSPCSVGSLNINIEQAVNYGQYLGFSLGIDAEQVRNIMQNKLVHDSFLLKNPHIPMIDQNGHPYLYLEGQKIRSPKLFLQFIANGSSFY